ncbi:hypothetical protein Peur_038443 [Populus x canadensis]
MRLSSKSSQGINNSVLCHEIWAKQQLDYKCPLTSSVIYTQRTRNCNEFNIP